MRTEVRVLAAQRSTAKSNRCTTLRKRNYDQFLYSLQSYPLMKNFQSKRSAQSFRFNCSSSGNDEADRCSDINILLPGKLQQTVVNSPSSSDVTESGC